MKLACSSTPIEPAISAGRLTQLEWLDLCARDLDVDGVVFEAQHFPRTDSDYSAQLKKMASDLGLTVAALACDQLLDPADTEPAGTAAHWFDLASQLGAPIVIARTPATRDASDAWSGLVETARSSAAEAKRRNVTLAVRNAPSTQCASAAELKRLAKDVDSSWVRFALDVATLDPPEPLGTVLPRVVIAVHALGESPRDEVARLLAVLDALGSFRGFLALETPAGRGVDGIGAGLTTLRAALARRTLSLHRS